MSSAIQLLDTIIEELKNSTALPEVIQPAEKNNHKIDEPKAKKESSAKSKGKEKGTTSNEAPKLDNEITINSIDLRVGVITKVSKHPTADKLYCEEIDVGEPTARSIASGLVPFYSLEQMQGKKLIVVCNLKPKNLVGFKSNGMVLCASKVNADGTHTVEFVDPPADSKPGDRIVGEGVGNDIEVLTSSKCDKTKAFDIVAADLKVDSEGVPNWKGHRLVTIACSACTVPTVRDSVIH